MSKPYTITLSAEPTADEVQFIENGLRTFNLQYAPPENYQRLAVLLHGPGGQLMGGILGNTWWNWLRIDILWVDKTVRYQGWGTRLMQAAEAEAIRRGCHHAFLDTMSFQALPFYLRLGYTIFGQLDDLPLGHSRYFLQKELTPVEDE
jgi:GNAT superfamily N-acetyltransferase